MPWMGAGCCSTAGGCTYFSDDFDRDDSDSLGSDWEEELGNWRIASNQLKADAGVFALAKCTTRHPRNDESMCAEADFVEQSGVYRLIVNYIDAANYLYGRYDFDSLQLQAWERVDGVETLIRGVNAPTLGNTSPVQASVQFTRQRLVVSAHTVNEEAYGCVPYIEGGYWGGVASEEGGGEVDNFRLKQHNRTWAPFHDTDCCWACCDCIAGRDERGFDVWVCIPRKLLATASVTGDFVGTDMDGAEIELFNDNDILCDDVAYVGSNTICNETVSAELRCAGSPGRMTSLDDWEITNTSPDPYCSHFPGANPNPDSTVCNPPSLTFGPYTVVNADPPMPGEYCGCLPIPGSGTVTWTITEAP